VPEPPLQAAWGRRSKGPAHVPRGLLGQRDSGRILSRHAAKSASMSSLGPDRPFAAEQRNVCNGEKTGRSAGEARTAAPEPNRT
jgi:hypothetical protein